MLREVVYFVTEYYYKILLTKKEEMEKALEGHEVKLTLCSMEGSDKTEVFFTRRAEKEKLLIVSDCPETVEKLKTEGFYVIALYHEKNKGQSFRGVRYAVENVGELSFKSYEEVYRRLKGLPWDILETERLLVRESTVEDVEEFYRIYKAPSVTYYMEDLFQSHEEERAYMEEYIRQMYGFYGFGLWTVLLRGQEKIIGRAGLSIREGYALPELGFVIDTDYQKQGYGYEVCSAILAHAKEELGFEKVQALVKEKNTASRRLLKKLGFREEKEVTEKKQKYLLAAKKL